MEADAGPAPERREGAAARGRSPSCSAPGMPDETRGLARLAASYLIAGDVETARRYVTRARESIEEANHATD